VEFPRDEVVPRGGGDFAAAERAGFFQ
jgi:hypothetical protein